MNCTWPASDEQMIAYHNEEWGVPVHDDKKHFEFIVLDSFQAGLSWKTILHRRKHFKKAFANFDVKKVAKFDEAKIDELVQNEGIIRHRGKISAAINNAKLFIEIQKEHGSFSGFIWKYVDHKPIINNWNSIKEVPATTEISDQIAKDFKKRGFKFFGPTTIYAHMQATGMVNDHTTDCFCK